MRSLRRSTKAGVETPATHGPEDKGWQRAIDAQRRPESKPRRHRSAESPARSSPGALNEGRSRNPGDTAHEAVVAPKRPIALNEGRSRNPGDTFVIVEADAKAAHRSTKAGVETPATLLIMASCVPLRAIASQFDHRTAERVAERPRSAG